MPLSSFSQAAFSVFQLNTLLSLPILPHPEYLGIQWSLILFFICFNFKWNWIPNISSFSFSLLLLARPHSLALLPLWPFVPPSLEGFFFTLAFRRPQGSESTSTSRPTASVPLPLPAQPSYHHTLLSLFNVSPIYACKSISTISPGAAHHIPLAVFILQPHNWVFLPFILSSLGFHSKMQSGSVLCLLKSSK